VIKDGNGWLITDSIEKANSLITDFSKAFNLVPHDQLLTRIAASGVDSRVVVWTRELLLSHTQRVRVGGQVSEKSE
jgi:hypothetical protein